jgi:hypothetical protein
VKHEPPTDNEFRFDDHYAIWCNPQTYQFQREPIAIMTEYWREIGGSSLLTPMNQVVTPYEGTPW